FLDGNRDVDCFAGSVLKQRNVEPRVASIANLRLRITNHRLKVSLVLLRFADQFHIIFELGSVVGLGKEIFQENRVRNSDWPQKMHGVTKLPATDMPIALEPDAAYFDLGTFTDNKRHADRGRRNRANLRADSCELVSVLG